MESKTLLTHLPLPPSRKAAGQKVNGKKITEKGKAAWNFCAENGVFCLKNTVFGPRVLKGPKLKWLAWYRLWVYKFEEN